MSLNNFSCLRNVSGDSVTEIGWIVDHPDDPDFDTRGNGYATAVIVSLFFLIGVPWNLFVICTIVRKKLYKNPTVMLLLNLAITNLLLCVLVMPFNIITGFSGEYFFGTSDVIRCRVCQTGVLVITLSWVSIHTLSLMSVDRFIYLKAPLAYNVFVTQNRMLIALAIVWVVSIVTSLPPLFGFGEIKFTYTVSTCVPHLVGETHVTQNYYYSLLLISELLLPILVLLTMYIWILCIARRTLISRSLRSNAAHEAQELQNNENWMIQLRLVRVFAAIFTANFITWLPMIAMALTGAIVGPDRIPTALYTFVYLSLLSEAVFHPILEACLVREVRKMTLGSLKVLLPNC